MEMYNTVECWEYVHNMMGQAYGRGTLSVNVYIEIITHVGKKEELVC